MNRFLKPGLLLLGVLVASDVFANDIETSQISGTLMFDYGFSNEEDQGFSSEIRRARIALKHSLNDDWQAKLQVSFDEENSTSEIGDAYVRFKGIANLNITMGKMKEAFGLENMTSSKNITFLERSMASNAFGPGKNTGLMLSGSPGNVTWSVALMDLPSETQENAPYAITSRMTWAPVQAENQMWHVGFSSSLRQLNGEEFEIDERSELHNSQKIIATGKIATEQLQLTGVEFAWLKNSWSLQGEYMSANLQAVDASEDGTFDGYYLQGSYFLNADKRRYKTGVFTGIKPNSKEGAWELTSRYSVLDTSEASEGSEVQTATLGVNYYYHDNLRLMSNVLHSQSSSQTGGDTSSNGASFRIQYLF